VLANWILAEGRDEELGRLLEQFADDATAAWAYNRALWLFRKEGPGAHATAALRKAVESNPFVPDYLLGARRLPPAPPSFMTLGGESEAVEYAGGAAKNWLETPSALDWLRTNTSAKTTKATRK
jgi:hypothetical protein